MPQPFKSFLILLTTLFWLGQPMPATAQASGAVAFSLPAGNLGDVLDLYSRQAGVTVSYEDRLVQGINVSALAGNYRPAEALSILLRDSPLEAVPVGDGAWVIQSIPETTADAFTLQPIQVQGHSTAADQVYRTAGSVNVIEQKEIERFRGTSVGDIFQGTPGVLVGENRNSGGLDINIRGMQGQGRVPVVVDGARQETTVYRGYAGVSSRTYLDPDLISEIEVQKGPVMSADGTGATGGVVSMRTIGANDIIKPGKDWGIRLRGSVMGNSSSPPPSGTAAGLNGTGRTYRTDCAHPALCEGEHALPDSFGATSGMNRPSLMDMRSWAGSLAVAKRFERFDLIAAYAQRNQGNYYTGSHGPTPEVEFNYRPLPFYTEVTAIRDGVARFRGEERVVNSNNRSNTLLLKSNLYLSEDQTWELGYQRYDSEYGELMPSQLIWLDQIKQTDNSTVTAHTYTSRYNLNPIDKNWLNLDFNLWHTHTRTVNRSYSEDIYEGFSDTPRPERYDRWGGDLSNEMLLNRWGRHTFSYGFTAQREEIDTDIPASDGDTSISNAGFGRIGDRTELSAFLNWQWQPHPTVTLDAGIRYLRAETDDHKLVVPQGREENLYDDDGNVIDTVYVESVFCVDNNGDGACDPIRYRTRNSGSAPVVSVSWEPWMNGVQFYARYAEGLRMPSLFEATQGWSVQPALDVPLKPERAVNREIGLNILQRDLFLNDDRLALKLSRFRNVTHDYLTRTSQNVWEEGNQIFVMRNIDSVTLHGTELALEYDAGFAYTKLGGTKYDHIEVCHYGSYRRERCSDYGVANSYFNNMIPPKWHASATLGARLFKRRLDIGSRVTFMGQRTPTPPFNDDTSRGFNRPVPWHDYRLVDVYASWQYDESLTIDFNIDNLTDQYYLDALSLGLVPAPGRTARLSLTMKF
ncbi:TonB-dependent receptor [Alcanivorax sp. 24]|uniref:TonB-dependent receptor n=1 Tax=Alcanivorax sp. 24 TaxID=2545266 RepID=UPI00105B2779|nr:TonB-dependent receptor [Alcanivorax sp. 24]